MNKPVAAKKYLPILLTLAALATVGTAPAFAKTIDHHPAQSSRRLYMYAPDDASAARDTAIHDCSVEAGKWSNSSWQTTQFAVYGTCMSEHDQQQ
jgi:hypothetical protein